MASHLPLTDQRLNDYATLAETALHLGENVTPRVVTELVQEVHRIQRQRRYLIRQLAQRDATSGNADRKLGEFLSGAPAETEAQTPLTDDRNPADSHEPMLWNDATGTLLAIHPDSADDEDRPTVAVRTASFFSETVFHTPQHEAPRLAADLCAAAGFRDLSELLLTALADDAAGSSR